MSFTSQAAEECYRLVYDYFGCSGQPSPSKAHLWFSTPNPKMNGLLPIWDRWFPTPYPIVGDLKPYYLFSYDREEELLALIKKQILNKDL